MLNKRVGIWLQTIGRVNICFDISILSWFSSAPCQGKFLALIKLYGYLNKYPNKMIKVDPSFPKVRGKVVILEGGIGTFKQKYPKAYEELDPNFP